MTIGEKILNLRKARLWSQEELAERVGVTRQAVSRWESDAAKPDTDKVIAICDLFGVSADYLLRDQVSGGGEAREAQPQPRQTTAIGDAIRAMTLGEWIAAGLLILGVLTLTILRFVYIFKDTNYFYGSVGGLELTGFDAFILTEELGVLYYGALACLLAGAAMLIWNVMRRFFHWDKESNG